jgi:hypothetical protein
VARRRCHRLRRGRRADGPGGGGADEEEAEEDMQREEEQVRKMIERTPTRRRRRSRGAQRKKHCRVWGHGPIGRPYLLANVTQVGQRLKAQLHVSLGQMKPGFIRACVE